MKIHEFTKTCRRQFPHVVIDEAMVRGGEFIGAYGHTGELLVSWGRKGNGMSAVRKPGEKFASMHDELYRAAYERDKKFDLKTAQ